MNWYKKAQTQRIFYRGTIPKETKRIKEPFQAAKGMTFMARQPQSAKNYGEHIETIIAKPEAKILYSESPEFWKLIHKQKPPNGYIGSALKQNETTIDAINDAIIKAQKAGYDAVSFEQDSDIGTIILNENAFIRKQNKKAQLKDFFTANLTEEQQLKKELLSEKLSYGTGMIIKKVREQNNFDLGQAIDYIYDRLEKGLNSMTCKNCKWLNENWQGKLTCNNTNWTPADDIKNAACDGISWEKKI